MRRTRWTTSDRRCASTHLTAHPADPRTLAALAVGLASAQPSVTPFIGAFRSEQLGGINVERCIQDPTADMRGSSCFYLPRTVEQHRLLIEYHVSIDPSFEWEAPRRFISEATPETENGRLFTLTLDGNTLHLAYVVYRRPSHRFYESYWWIQDRVRRD